MNQDYSYARGEALLTAASKRLRDVEFWRALTCEDLALLRAALEQWSLSAVPGDYVPKTLCSLVATGVGAPVVAMARPLGHLHLAALAVCLSGLVLTAMQVAGSTRRGPQVRRLAEELVLIEDTERGVARTVRLLGIPLVQAYREQVRRAGRPLLMADVWCMEELARAALASPEPFVPMPAPAAALEPRRDWRPQPRNTEDEPTWGLFDDAVA